MTENLRPGFPLRINPNLYGDKSLPAMQPKPAEDDDSEYVIKWGEYNSHMVNIFHQFCREDQLTDVTLSTDTKSFKAHKLILSACSPYFRQLFISNPCKHPTVFFKDITAGHMKLLIDYMYMGRIAVKQNELGEILKTASSLQIQGFATGEAPTPSPDIETPRTGSSQSGHSGGSSLPGNSGGSGHSGNSIHGPSHTGTNGAAASNKRRTDGRKSSKPKKLRLSEDRENVVTSPMYPMMNSPRFPIVQEKERSTSPEHVIQPVINNHPSDDNIAVSDDEENELVIDQPVDFSTSKTEAEMGNKAKPETPRSSNIMPRTEMSSGLMGSWEEHLANLTRSAHRSASRDSREDQPSSGEENVGGEAETRQHPQMDLTASITAQLQNHLLASLPSQMSWLNGMAGVHGVGGHGIGGAPPNTPSNDNRERTPQGGIRTGEIGPNGKPSVECEECGKTLADPSSLYRHRKIHTGEKPHKCPFCEKRFIQRYNMKQHIKTHRMEAGDTEDSMNLTPKLEEMNQMGLLQLPYPSFPPQKENEN